jgi:hypothetical protein
MPTSSSKFRRVRTAYKIVKAASGLALKCGWAAGDRVKMSIGYQWRRSVYSVGGSIHLLSFYLPLLYPLPSPCSFLSILVPNSFLFPLPQYLFSPLSLQRGSGVITRGKIFETIDARRSVSAHFVHRSHYFDVPFLLAGKCVAWVSREMRWTWRVWQRATASCGTLPYTPDRETYYIYDIT